MKDFVHMSKFERVLFGGAKWPIKPPCWLVLQLKNGIAYLQSGLIHQELLAGGATVVPPNSEITILASILGEATLLGCSINIGSLTGLLTLTERLCLEKEAALDCAPFREVAPSHPLASRIGQCFQNPDMLELRQRLGFLDALADWLSPSLERAAKGRGQTTELNPKDRLKQLLNQMPESELTELSPSDVARHLCCSERHAGRLFNELCGCSFRKYVSDLRLKRACQLLVQGNHKIIDVALESGHSSLSLFNYNFKSRFRMTPSEWRERHLAHGTRPVTAFQRAMM